MVKNIGIVNLVKKKEEEEEVISMLKSFPFHQSPKIHNCNLHMSWKSSKCNYYISYTILHLKIRVRTCQKIFFFSQLFFFFFLHKIQICVKLERRVKVVQ